jgi:hypothetical protein
MFVEHFPRMKYTTLHEIACIVVLLTTLGNFIVHLVVVKIALHLKYVITISIILSPTQTNFTRSVHCSYIQIQTLGYFHIYKITYNTFSQIHV